MKEGTTTETKALLNVKELCTYLGIEQTKARELLSDPANGYTVRIKSCHHTIKMAKLPTH